MRNKVRLGLVLVSVCLVAGLVAWLAMQKKRELPRSALVLRDGLLYVRGETKPFNGILFENHTSEVRKLAIEIRRGQAHGVSKGWHSNGQLEVEEHFVNGVSRGLRTRWHANGQKRNEAQIVDGKLHGRFTEWHNNGQKALEMTLRADEPEGSSESWHPSGALKARVRHEKGLVVAREFFPDSAQLAQTTPAGK